MLEPSEIAALLDWKRRIFELYASVRASEPSAGWELWRKTRDELFAHHPQSPVPLTEREAFNGLRYFPYDPSFRVKGEVSGAHTERLEIGTSGQGTVTFTRYGVCSFQLHGRRCSLDLFWLDGYGGGLFLPFRDATSGAETYGAGRYLYDTVKGADLGARDGSLILDFNFAYNPSCSYDPRWVCPLAPPNNRLDIDVRAGEQTPQIDVGAG